MNKDYLEFLEKKKVAHIDSGFDVDESDLNEHLFSFQKYIVKAALKRGRYAVFSGTGTGKTIVQCAWADVVVKRTGKPVLILAPLAVAGQTIELAKTVYDIEVKRWNSHWQERYQDCNLPMDRGHIFIDNYDQLDNIDCSLFGGIVLEESSIVKNEEGAIRNKVIDGFKNTPYKLCCTATPSPNDPMELGNHSEFLNVMLRTEMLSMYFVHDGGETSKWRLKGHAEQRFWDWVSTWAVMFEKPTDIGFTAEGYDLPPLNMIENQIKTPLRANGMLFNDTAVSATDFNAELRITRHERMSEVIDIVNNSNETFIIWIKHNEEGEYLIKHIPGAIDVHGSHSREYKEEKLLGFAKGDFRVLVTKGKIAMFGLNYQHCHNQVFASLDFSFEQTFQCIRRSYRYGQKKQVNIHLITTDTMQNVSESLKRKQSQFSKMQASMTKAVNKNLNSKKHLKTDREFREVKTDDYTLQLGDCVQLIKDIPDNSIGLSVFSPPFASLYTYSDELEDMGNSKDYKEFLEAYNFLSKELYRIIKTGRNVAIHCMDLPIQKGKEGVIGLRDFSNMIRQSMEDAGFIYHSRITIWKSPIVEMQRTKALGLLHKQLRKDAAMSRVGLPDYVLVFRKDGEAIDPVHVGIPVEIWQKWASPVWMDIDYSDTLNYREGKDEKDERHIAPLQLPTVERLIALYTNEGDTIYTPFGGIGTEPYQAVKMKRKAIAHELKTSYFGLMVENMAAIMAELSQIEMSIA